MQDNEKWAAELKIIAGILDKTILEKSVKWGADVYTFNGKNVVSYGGFKNYFTIWFYNGVFLSDKYQLLVNAQEGKTKSLRQWRMVSASEIDAEKLLEYINEAIEIEKQGLKIAPNKFESIPLEPLMAGAFEKDDILKVAFEKLTPGKQKEYIIYINEAKQEKTKLARLEKITPMILEGKGLNDKYK